MSDFDPREYARDLRRQLNDHNVDLVELTEGAATVFKSLNLAAQTRWLEFEQHGYTSATETRSLHDVLGLPAGDRLVVQVKAYRVQVGELAEGPLQGDAIKFSELAAAQVRVRESGGIRPVRLEFPENPDRPWLPTAGIFGADVFDRILLGLRAVLHLQLASVAR
jgi:hypothetical protein